MKILLLTAAALFVVSINANKLVKRQVIEFDGKIVSGPKSSCTTPDGFEGTCVEIKKCEPLNDQLRSAPTPSFLSFLEKSVCRYVGRVPIICCANNNSPELTQFAPVAVETPTPTGSTFSPRSCGVSGVKEGLTMKVIGGRIAKKGAWPWIATLGYQGISGGLEFHCGATLITEKHVLTAAHCVFQSPELRTVRLGEHDINTDNEAQHEDFTIAEKIIHVNYNSRTFSNDIAILKLDRPVSFKKHISPVCLPTLQYFVNNPLTGIDAIVAGWGHVEQGNASSSSPVLKETELSIRSNRDCQNSYEGFVVVIDNTKLCAGEGGTDACQGDSGGPLVVQSPEGDYTAIGIVSVGHGCADEKFPGIYTRITSYLDWIEDNLN